MFVVTDLRKLRQIHLNRAHHELFEQVAKLIGCSTDRSMEHFDVGFGVQKDLKVSPLLIVF